MSLLMAAGAPLSDGPIPDSGIAGLAIDVVELLGGPGAGLIVAVENLFPPVPSEVVLPLTGFAASDGVLSLTSALLWTTAGSVLGALLLYWIGRRFGRDRTTALMARLPLVDRDDVARAESWFADHGRAAVFFGRMVPGVRSLVSIPAGVERMPLGRFTAYTTAGSALWNSLLVLAGFWLGERWAVVEGAVGIASRVVLVGLVGLIAWFAVRRVRARAR